MAGILRQHALKEQFQTVNDEKLRLSLMGLADKYSEKVRVTIYMTYHDPQIQQIYRNIRSSGIYEKGGKSKVRRKIVEFPNSFVYDYCNTVLTALYGKDWLKQNKALKHELIRPFWVVNKL